MSRQKSVAENISETDDFVDGEQPYVKLFGLWIEAVQQELALVGEHVSVATKDLHGCISDLSQSDMTEDGAYKVSRADVFKLVQALQFEDRLQQELQAISNVVSILGGFSGVTARADDKAVELGEAVAADVNEALIEEMKKIVTLGQLRDRIEETVRERSANAD